VRKFSFFSKSQFFKRQTTLLTRVSFLVEESSSDTGPASNGAKSPAEVIEIQEFEVDENLKVFDKETAIPYTLDTKELG